MDHLENELTNNPYRLKSWTNYLTFLESSNPYQRFKVYERALKYLPRSYKLWHGYLGERTKLLRNYPLTDKAYDNLISTYERALVHMNKMPVIWYVYTYFIIILIILHS